MMGAGSLWLLSSSFNTYCTAARLGILNEINGCGFVDIDWLTFVWYRMSQLCLGVPSEKLQKRMIMYTTVFPRTQNYHFNLYNIPSTPFPCCSTLKCFGSSRLDTQLQGNHASSTLWPPTHSKRYFIRLICFCDH